MRSLQRLLPFLTFFQPTQPHDSPHPSILPNKQSSSPQEIPVLQAVLTPLDSKSADKRAVATRGPNVLGSRKATTPQSHGSLAQSERSLSDWEVENIVLLATVDGSLYSNDRSSGQQLWSFHSEVPMVQTIYHQEQDENNQWRWIVEPNQDGSLYTFTAGSNAAIQKLGPTVKELADHLSPWYSSDSQFVYTAEKRNSLLTLNASSGVAIKYFSPGESGFVGSSSCRSVKRLDIEEENECEPTPTINLGRIDYTVSIQDRETSKKICTIKYFEWTPNVRDRDLQGQYSSTMDSKYIYSQYNGGIVAVEHNGRRTDNRFLYRSKFSSPVVRVFDLARPQGVDSGDISLVLLPQPVAPRIIAESPSRQDDKVFVNCTESGSWYALSEANYPSVTDGAANAKCYKTLTDDARVYGEDTSFNPAHFVGVHLLEGHHESTQRPLIGGPDIPSVSETTPAHARQSQPIDNPPWTIDPPQESQSKNGYNLSKWNYILNIAILLALGAFAYPQVKDLVSKRGITMPSIDSAPLASASINSQETTKPRVRFAEPDEDSQSIDTQATTTATSENVERIDHAQDAINITPKASVKTEGRNVTRQRASTNGSVEGEESVDERTEGGNTETDTTSQKYFRKRKVRGGKRNKDKLKKVQEAAANPAEPNATIEAVAQTVAPKHQSIKPDNDSPRVNITDIDDGLVAVNDDRALTYDPSKCLGQGAGGTLVYEGVYKKKVVAVKRMIRNYYEVDSQEVEALRTAELHKNIIRFYHEEKDQHFLYIVVEKCQADLHNLFGERGFQNNRTELHTRLATEVLSNIQDSLYQLIDGLNYLHHLRIIHRDIKPQNILVAYPKTASDHKLRLVISDFGLCRTLPENQSTYKPTAGGAGAGTTGWKAPELINQLKLDTEAQRSTNGSTAKDSANSNEGGGSQGIKRAADIFSMGCLFYYIITQGHHPFDNPDDSEWWLINRDRNVKNNNVNYSKLEEMGADSQVACSMIKDMVSPNPAYRPSASKVMGHPFFWTNHETLSFLCEVSDAFEQECRDPPSSRLIKLEEGAPSVIPINRLTKQLDFLEVLDKKFVATMAKRRGYKGDYVFDLLRALRNKKAHYTELSPDIQALVGTIPDGYVKYWTDRFPKLVMHCYDTVADLGLDEQPNFNMYFGKRKL